MFVYPETMQTDAVEDFHEADSLQQHLNAMFAADAPPLDWDTEHQYTRNQLELYYLAHAAKPLSLQQLTEVCLCSMQKSCLDMQICTAHNISVFLCNLQAVV